MNDNQNAQDIQAQPNTDEQKVESVVEEQATKPVLSEPVEPVTEEKIEEKTAVEQPEVVEKTVEPARSEPTEPVLEEKTEQEVVLPNANKGTEPEEASSPASTADNRGRWYIIHTYSGHENKVTKSLKQRVESMGFKDRIFEIIVPTRNTIKVAGGKKETVIEKIFPGYVLVRMELDDESWLLVRTTQGVTAFIGAGNKPTPISDKEVEAIQKFMKTEEPLYKTAFVKGEAVKIIDGPFTDFLGSIDDIDEARGKLKVLVSIFGRETPVELDFLQVSKL